MEANTSRRSRRALRITLIIAIATCVALVWTKDQVTATISSALRSQSAPQLILSIAGGIALLILIAPQSINLVRRYTSALRQDLVEVSENYREWSRMWEFIQLSREALRRQKEIAEEVGIRG